MKTIHDETKPSWFFGKEIICAHNDCECEFKIKEDNIINAFCTQSVFLSIHILCPQCHSISIAWKNTGGNVEIDTLEDTC